MSRVAPPPSSFPPGSESFESRAASFEQGAGGRVTRRSSSVGAPIDPGLGSGAVATGDGSFGGERAQHGGAMMAPPPMSPPAMASRAALSLPTIPEADRRGQMLAPLLAPPLGVTAPPPTANRIVNLSELGPTTGSASADASEFEGGDFDLSSEAQEDEDEEAQGDEEEDTMSEEEEGEAPIPID